MITYTITLSGDNNADFRRIISQLIQRAKDESALLQTGPKTGREYRRKGRVHVASAPGEAPAVDTGFLVNSIQTEMRSDTEGVITIAAEYAEALEFGTEDIAERPFVRPAIDSVIKQFSTGGILAGLGD